ncbi:MAG: T9SS type A sorting domain-containing protein, partial [Bacteroidetes bacterium]|nr:T9SS type A sorting domain-containing protein [Bacteroidota bacterium]
NYQLSIIDLNGKVLFSGSTKENGTQIDISSLPAGVYQIVMVNNNERIVKQLVRISY